MTDYYVRWAILILALLLFAFLFPKLKKKFLSPYSVLEQNFVSKKMIEPGMFLYEIKDAEETYTLIVYQGVAQQLFKDNPRGHNG